MKKIDIAKEVCANLKYVKEDCLNALVARLSITRGNASIYFAKAVDASAGATRTISTQAVAPKVAPKPAKDSAKDDASKAKIRDAHNKAHKHLSYTEPTKGAQ